MELISLDKYNRQASFGLEYNKLNNEYPRWSIDLHSYGYIMDKDEIEYIAIYGLINWYIEQNIKIDIHYNYNEQLLYFINNPNKITFYDWIKINKLADYINNPIILNTKCLNKHLELLSYDKQIFIKYSVLNWGYFLIDTIGKNILNVYLTELYEYVKNDNYLYEPYYCLFLKRNSEIKELGIIYHRLKIILEKNKQFNITLEDIYKIDKVVDYIQTIIYNICLNYINKLNKPNYEINMELINSILFSVK
jgi:hypothetical protein